MCPDKSWNLISQQVVVPTWYMKHVFRDLRGSWRCLSFAKAKHHKYKQSQADLARSLNLQRASARAAAAATSRNHNPHLQHQHQHQHHHQHNQQQLLHQHPSSSRRRSSSKSKSKSKSNGASADKSRWMFKSFSALYCNSEKPRFKAKDSFAKMKSLINSSFERREAALSPSSSMNELIPTTIDFDLENALLSTTEDSDIASTGAPPSRRSSGSFFYPPTPETSCAGDPRHSPYQIAKHQRRKRATVIREVKNSSTSAIGAAAGGANGLALGSDAASLAARVRAAGGGGGGGGRGRRSSPENLSVSAVLTMDTGSCTPCRSISTAGWLENYDLMTESLSSWTPSEKASSVVDVPSCTPSQRSFSGPLPLGGGAPRRDFLHHHHHHHQQQQQQQQLQQHHGIQHHKKPSSVHSFSQRPPSIASSMADFTDLPRRSVSSIPTTPHHHHHHQQHHYQPQPPSQIQQLQAPAAAARQVNTQKDFQEAIVDIILENDVNDLVDLEEFLQGYFRLNTLYQDIIQQFFNDLSNDLAHPHVSRAPTVFARLASANCKSSAAKSKSKPLGKPASSKHTSPTTTTS